MPRPDPFGVVLGSRQLRDILGQATYGRLDAVREGRRLRAPLEGRWIPPESDFPARVLQIRAGRDAIAELTDLDGDRVIDVVLLSHEP